ncbi:MAG: glycosyltransferase family 2 protein [Candidatus Saccharimonadales bacterium]
MVPGYYNVWAHQQLEHPPLREQPAYNSAEEPNISIVVPAFNTPKRYLYPLVYSIVSQAYHNWELVLVNASDQPGSRDTINKCADIDKRIKVIEIENGGISTNTNVGIKESSGNYIAFADHDDTLDPFALQEMANAIVNQGADLVYSDEDKISDNGEIYFDPHFKPDWSPDLLTHLNYINHLSVIKKELIIKAGLLNPARDGAQDYDLLLRVTDLEPKIVHVPKVLYHWRAARNSTAQDFSSKKHITNAGRQNLEDHFRRVGVIAKVVPENQKPGFYEVRFEPIKKVSVVIMPFASDALLRLFVELLIKRSKLTGLSIELFVPNGVQPRSEYSNITVKAIDNNPKYLGNSLAASTSAETVIINQIALPISKDWLQGLCAPLRLKHVGAVAPLIVRDGMVIEDCGLVLAAPNEYLPLFRNHGACNVQTYFGNTDWVRDVDALSGGVTAARTKELREFINANPKITSASLITGFTKANKARSRHNVLNAKVTLDNYSIRFAPKDDIISTHFSSSILIVGMDFEPYTPESIATNILMQIADQEKIL